MSKEKILAMQKQVTGKLMAAISMLLVSAILMCLTSYAWFILSTAPEVSNLKTTAGANGALEIALQSTNEAGSGRAEITSAVGSSHAKNAATVSNTYWGNVVDLTEGYGLDNIQLYPSRLKVNATEVDGKTSYMVDTGSILQVPQFGQDGRVTSLLNATKTHYNKDGQFVTGANWGVNVLGAVNPDNKAEDNTITLTYRRDTVLKQAREKVAAYRAELRDKMETTIAENSMGILGWLIAQSHNKELPEPATGLSDAVANYVSAMETVVADATEALQWALLANAAADETRYDSQKDEDMKALGELYAAVMQMPLTGEPSLYSVATQNGYKQIADAANAMATAAARVSSARELVDAGLANNAGMQLVAVSQTYMYGEYIETKDQVSDVMSAVIYDFTRDLKRTDNPLGLATKDTIFTVASADPTQTNLFSAIAAVIGDYTGDMSLWFKAESKPFEDEDGEIDYTIEKSWVTEEPTGDMVRGKVNLVYSIKATSGLAYSDWTEVDNLTDASGNDISASQMGVLGQVSKQIDGIEAPGVIQVEVKRPDVTAYGYSVDLAFKSSEDTDLLLQQTGIGRVSGNDEDQDLLGGGSTVQFTVAGDMTTEQVKDLLQGVYIVFMNTVTGTVYKVAAVDPDNIVVTWLPYPATATATLALYEPAFDEAGNLTLGRKITGDNKTITTLTADKEYYISAVVYLNGDAVDATAFSATQELSLTGAMNLQFASSVTLTPMNYDFTAAGIKRKDG